MKFVNVISPTRRGPNLGPGVIGHRAKLHVPPTHGPIRRDQLIVDASTGTVLVAPDEGLLNQFQALQEQQRKQRQAP